MLVCWHTYLASTQSMKCTPTHWPDLTFCDHWIKSSPGLLQKQVTELQGTIHFWMPLLHSFKRKTQAVKGLHRSYRMERVGEYRRKSEWQQRKKEKHLTEITWGKKLIHRKPFILLHHSVLWGHTHTHTYVHELKQTKIKA